MSAYSGVGMNENLASAQTIRYAEELGVLYAREREQRQDLEKALERLKTSYRETVRALSATLELRDDVTGGHAERVARLALRLTARAAPELLADPGLEYGFLLHDLGKIGVPDAVLLKPGPLDDDEWSIMREHPVLGESIVSQIPFLRGVVQDVVLSHHERWDGTGYPRGLAGADIPLAARIFTIVDTFDAMTSTRPYRDALPIEQALDEIAACAGTQFDPAIAASFVDLMQAEVAR